MLDTARVEATVAARKLSRAREFYEGVLGLRPSGAHNEGVDVLYACGAGTTLLVYEHPRPMTPAHTAAHFVVDDVAATVHALRERGVVFEEYDLPELKTVDGIATAGEHRFAWFKDPDNNIIGVHD